jgi:hypothetical protein
VYSYWSTIEPKGVICKSILIQRSNNILKPAAKPLVLIFNIIFIGTCKIQNYLLMSQSFQQQPFDRQTPPKNYLVEAILVTIFCCLPMGILGIIFAMQVNSKFANGDYEGALGASKDAAKFTKIGFIVSLVFVALWLAFIFIFGGWAIMQEWRHNND